jgi:hypothetical protein
MWNGGDLTGENCSILSRTLLSWGVVVISVFRVNDSNLRVDGGCLRIVLLDLLMLVSAVGRRDEVLRNEWSLRCNVELFGRVQTLDIP